jgi:hypothetical protein
VEQNGLVERLAGLWVLEVYVEPSIFGFADVIAEAVGIEGS